MKPRCIILIVLLLAAIGTIIYLASGDEHYYKPVAISGKNTVLNGTDSKHFDTVLHVGLEAAGLEGISVVVNNLTQEAQSQISGEMLAHVRFHEGVYYIFIKDLDRYDAIKTLAHEIIHILQYNSGDLCFDEKTLDVTWKGTVYKLETVYDDRPWEADAYKRETALATSIENILYP